MNPFNSPFSRALREQISLMNKSSGGLNVAAPTNTLLPVIVGGLMVNNVLAVAPGIWTGNPLFTYAWKSNGTIVSTASTYTRQASDISNTITCDLTGTNTGGSLTKTTAGVPSIASVAPQLNIRLDKTTPDSLGSFGYSRGSAGTYSDAGTPNVMRSAASNVARYEWMGSVPMGLKMESYSENYCTNYNANPTDLTGVTTGGDAAAVASLVSDTGGLLSTAVHEYGHTIDLRQICTAGKLYKLDNTAGTTPAYMEFPGNAGDTSNPYTLSLYAALSGAAGTISYGALGTVTGVLPVSANLTRSAAYSIIPDNTTRQMRVTIPAGAVLYCILNQMENSPSTTSVIVTAGAVAARQLCKLADSGIASRSYYNRSAGACIVELDFDDAYRQAQATFASISFGTSSSTTDILAIKSGTTTLVKQITKANNVAATITIGANAGQSATYIGSIDRSIASYSCGFSWTEGDNFCAIMGGMANVPHTLGTFANALNRIDIGSSAYSSWMVGHVRSVKMWTSQPTIPQIGQFCNFVGAKAIIGIGQSNMAYNWNSSADNTSRNDGERGYISAMDAVYPNNRNYLLHCAWGGASYQTSGGNSFHDSTAGTPGVLLTHAVDVINGFIAGGGLPIVMSNNQGETDINDTAAQFQANYAYVWDYVKANCYLPNLQVLAEMIGRREDSSGSNGGYEVLRSVQKTVATWYNANSAHGPERFCQPMGGDPVHETYVGYGNQGPINARAAMGLVGAPVVGAFKDFKVIGATRTGATINITFNLPYGVTDFAPKSGNSSVNSPWRYFDQDTTTSYPTGTEIKITSWVSTSPTTATLTLASTPSHAGLLYYGFGVLYTSAAIVPTTLIRANDTYGLPLESNKMLLPYTG